MEKKSGYADDEEEPYSAELAAPTSSSSPSPSSFRKDSYGANNNNDKAPKEEDVHFDWNEKFQKLLQKSFDDPQNELQRTFELRKLCIEFAEISKEFGVTIINELYLPVEKKTIPPATKFLGGIAGGLVF